MYEKEAPQPEEAVTLLMISGGTQGRLSDAKEKQSTYLSGSQKAAEDHIRPMEVFVSPTFNAKLRP